MWVLADALRCAMPCPVPSREKQPRPRASNYRSSLALHEGCPCRATATPGPFTPRPAQPQRSCVHGSGAIPFPGAPAWTRLWPLAFAVAGVACRGQCHLSWPVSLAVAGVICRGHCGAPSPAAATYQGHFLEQLCPRGLTNMPRGFHPRHRLCPDHRAAEPVRVQARALMGSPPSPGAAVSSREGRGKPPSVASELPGPGGAACTMAPLPLAVAGS